MLNVKTMLIMTIRKFDIYSAYEEWDQVHFTQKIKIVNEKRAYQISLKRAHLANEFSCKIRWESYSQSIKFSIQFLQAFVLLSSFIVKSQINNNAITTFCAHTLDTLHYRIH